MQQEGSCEGSYRSLADGKIYRYLATYHGSALVAWRVQVSWGESQALEHQGEIAHNILSGHSLQELVRAHVVAELQHLLGASSQGMLPPRKVNDAQPSH